MSRELAEMLSRTSTVLWSAGGGALVAGVLAFIYRVPWHCEDGISGVGDNGVGLSNGPLLQQCTNIFGGSSAVTEQAATESATVVVFIAGAMCAIVAVLLKLRAMDRLAQLERESTAGEGTGSGT